MTQINRRVGKRDCVYRYNPFILYSLQIHYIYGNFTFDGGLLGIRYQAGSMGSRVRCLP